MKQYLSVIGETQFEYFIERSRFIAASYHVESESDTEKVLNQTRKKYSDATHNCYAYVLLDNVIRFSDDGEPSKTAGMPILEVIRGRKLYNTLVVVTRYFGGIKLGAGGLVRAYVNSTSGVLDRAKIGSYVRSIFYEIKLSYEMYPLLLNIAEKSGITVLNTVFETDIAVTFCIKEQDCHITDKIIDMLGGKCQISELKREFYPEKE